MKSSYFGSAVRVLLVVGAVYAAFLLGSAQRGEQIAAEVAKADKAEQAKKEAAAKRVPPALLKQMQAQQLNENRMMHLLQLMKQDPQAALAELAKLPAGQDTEALYRNLFANLAQDKDFALTAATLAYALPPSPDRVAALDGLLQSWSRSDPKGLLDWASLHSDDDSGLLDQAITMFARTSGDAALAEQYVGKISDASERNRVITSLAQTMSYSDPAGTLAWLNQVATGTTYDSLAKNIFSVLSSRDPATAASMIDSITDPNTRNGIINTLASSWGQKDPEAAMAWAQSLQGGDATRATSNILSGWAKSDPTAALAYIQGAADPSAYNSILPDIAQAMAAKDPQSALAYVQSLPDGPLKDKALNSAIVGMAQSNVGDALSFAASLPAGLQQNQAVNGVVNYMARRNPAQAANLIDQIPPGDAQTEAASTIAAEWVNDNAPALASWIATLPEGDVRDAAIVQEDSSREAAKHAETIFKAANTITNPDLRASQVQIVLTNWAVKSPDDAIKAVANANIPDAQKAAIVQSLNKLAGR